ncbi:MAG TPA: NUDIX hydrolase [Candidatus Limnocylindria bacterium]|jgi:predicted NUDIX family phosphoesterase
MPEQVLVIARAAVPGGCDFTGVRAGSSGMLAELRDVVGREGRYLDRPVAEESPEWKQLIPYVVVREGDDTFLMERTAAGGDSRLHRKASIGVGGHLNPVDHGQDPLMAGLAREWAEEVEAAWQPAFELVGLLNDDSNPVGAVHLGVVFTTQAQGPMGVRETEKLSGRMASAADIAEAWPRLETWSQLVAAQLLGLAERVPAG